MNPTVSIYNLKSILIIQSFIKYGIFTHHIVMYLITT